MSDVVIENPVINSPYAEPTRHFRNTNRPFGRPAGGKIAVKVTNHYGDEELKVSRV